MEIKLRFMNNEYGEKIKKLNWAGKVANIFVHNKVLSFLTILIIVAWGILSFVLMPKQYNPEIVAPAFIISTDYPNAESHEVYEWITRPMEDKISELKEVDSISSQSVSGGRSIVMVKFKIGSNQEDAKVSINQKLQDNIELKPLGAMEPIVRSIDPDDVPILDIGITSDEFSESSLRKLAFEIGDELKLVEGVSKIEIVGGRRNDLNIVLKSDEISVRDVSLEEIEAAILSSNNIYTVDIIGGDGKNTNLNVIGNIERKEDLLNLIIKNKNGSPIRLGDVAEIFYGPGEIANFVSLRDGDSASKPVVHIALSKIKGSNATSVSAGVREKLNELKGGLIDDKIKISILKDEGEVSKKERGKLTFDLLKSIIIVSVLLLAFLGIRNSMVATISIPLILLAVFGFGFLWGETINRITLFALILALGLLVDDAIVVIENISRYLRLYPNQNRKKLIVESVNEVGSALLLSTLTMAIAFIPMAFVTGMMGPYMGPIPFFVPVSLLVSLFLAVTINPFLADILTKNGRSIDKKNNFFLRIFSKIELYYENFLDYLLENKMRYRRFIFIIGAIFMLSVILIFSPWVPFRMLPKADRDQFYIYLDFPEGTEINKNREKTEQIEAILLADELIKSTESFMGIAPVIDFNGLFRGSSMRFLERQTTIKVNLISHEERNISSEKIAQKIRGDMMKFKDSNPDLEIKIVEDPPGPPVLSTFFVKIKGDEDGVREKISLDVLNMANEIDGVVDLDISKPSYSMNYVYKIDIQKAQLLGVNPQSVAKIIRASISGSKLSVFHADTRDKNHPEEEYIILRLDKKDRDSLGVLDTLSVNSADGKQIYLREILLPASETFSQIITSDDRMKSNYVSGEMENRSIIYASLDLLKELRSYGLENENLEIIDWSLFGLKYRDIATGREYLVEIDGEWKLTLEVFRDLGIAMLIAILLIYFILAAKVKSFVVPSLIMISIPLGFIGVFPGFAILYLAKGTYFNATSMIGIIALAGLSVKNSVIFLEYLEPLLESGEELKKSLIKTGKIRLLPIVLTSLTAILGSMTIISDPVWEGLAWAIIFGLSASTFLTLIVFPVMYYMIKNKN